MTAPCDAEVFASWLIAVFGFDVVRGPGLNSGNLLSVALLADASSVAAARSTGGSGTRWPWDLDSHALLPPLRLGGTAELAAALELASSKRRNFAYGVISGESKGYEYAKRASARTAAIRKEYDTYFVSNTSQLMCS